MYGVGSCVLYDSHKLPYKEWQEHFWLEALADAKEKILLLLNHSFCQYCLQALLSGNLTIRIYIYTYIHIYIYIQIDSGGMCWNRAGAFWQAQPQHIQGHRYHRYSAVMTSQILERLKQISAARPKIFTELSLPSLIAITDQPRQAASREDCGQHVGSFWPRQCCSFFARQMI